MSATRRASLTRGRWGKLKALEQAKQAAAAPENQPVSQRTLDRVTKERDEANKKLDAAVKENSNLKTHLRNVAKKVMDTANPTPFLSGTEKDPSEISEQELIALIGTLLPVEKNVTLESRIEELETRITLLSGELGKLLKVKLNVETRLKELGSCQDLDTVQQGLKQLWLESCTTKLFAGESFKLKDVDSSQDEQGSSSETPNHNSIPPSVQINLERVDIAAPGQAKKAGDTHIKNMQPDLRQLVIQDLSLYKGNGADWRLMAERVGVPGSLVSTWQQMKLSQPMKNVLGVWATSPGATVRMLHRHLVSPQMRCVMLAKRISDYYEV
ncbi:uncharacterized protein LOC143281659 [Babylonia areolata]|uniref:uncharacterized protein LOC143281659 n=1 Tax=Babylonia areolata TaxID=304850 RepID=UPI003FCFE67C